MTVSILSLVFGCGSAERVPAAEEFLPPGYTEKHTPKALSDAYTRTYIREAVWMRSFDCSTDWEGMHGYIMRTSGASGWKDETGLMMKSIDMSTIPQDIRNDVMKFYLSPGKTVGVLTVNLKLVRDSGGDLVSTADFFAVAGQLRLQERSS